MRAPLSNVTGLISSLALIMALAPAAAAQGEEGAMPMPPEAPGCPYLDARAGTWQGTGTMMGMAVTETVTMGWVLGNHYFRGEGTMVMTLPNGQELPFEMQTFTKPAGDGTYTGVYMDSFGMMGEYTAHLHEDGMLVMEWTHPVDGSQHRSIDTVNSDGWSTRFEVQQEDGSWAESGGMTYTRQ